VYSEIHSWILTQITFRDFAPKAVILSGGPESVLGSEARAPQAVFELGVPVLGICYGMQTMAAQLGGEVEAAQKREYGFARVRARGHSRLLRDIQDLVNDEGHGLLDVWMSHGDHVTKLPDGFKVIASTDNAPIAGMADDERGFYGLQFHPEVTHTRQGMAILHRFLHDIAGCQGCGRPRTSPTISSTPFDHR
jgi:GMP synthase (glutamine-hydrolysing)